MRSRLRVRLVLQKSQSPEPGRGQGPEGGLLQVAPLYSRTYQHLPWGLGQLTLRPFAPRMPGGPRDPRGPCWGRKVREAVFRGQEQHRGLGVWGRLRGSHTAPLPEAGPGGEAAAALDQQPRHSWDLGGGQRPPG